MNDELGASDIEVDQAPSAPIESSIPAEVAPTRKQRLLGFLKTHKQKFAILFFVFSILVAIVSFIATKPTPTASPITPSNMQSEKTNVANSIITDQNEESSVLVPQARLEVLEGVAYSNATQVYETVVVQDDDRPATYSFKFYKFGEINSGKYQGGQLVLAEIVADGVCKGPSCGKPFFSRYIVRGDEAIWLPAISQGFVFHNKPRTSTNPFAKFGLSLSEDAESTITPLEYPSELADDKGNKLSLVEVNRELKGRLNLNKLDLAFEDTSYGNIYTTKLGLSPDDGYIVYGGDLSDSSKLVDGCEGEDCFNTNAFFLFRPDGTYLKYAYKPPFSEKDIVWNNAEAANGYIYNTIASCSHDQYDYISVVPTSLADQDDLEAIGTVLSSKQPIYGLKNKNHSMYIDFYNKYKKYLLSSEDTYEDTDGEVSYDEFISSVPIFLWRDPFGRLIRFNNERFLPPYACEPILYLYPESPQEINVKLGSNVKLSASDPSYKNGWTVLAEPTGKLKIGGHEYPYLFWEGWSYIFPQQKTGFVVKEENVVGFLKETLGRLGLNEAETSDFLNAWAGDLKGSPYYFITFIPQDDIDRLYPLKIEPQPDTTIRVLIDYKPLERFISVPKLDFPEKPERNGFVVVEWGGLKR